MERICIDNNKAMNRIHSINKLKERRKDLRNKSTEAEKRLWFFLKDKQLKSRKFTRQHSIGRYIVDFYCSQEQLIMELDGEHHKEIDQKKYDEDRTKYFESIFKHVIRFDNSEVLFDTDKVLKEIEKNFKP